MWGLRVEVLRSAGTSYAPIVGVSLSPSEMVLERSIFTVGVLAGYPTGESACEMFAGEPHGCGSTQPRDSPLAALEQRGNAT